MYKIAETSVSVSLKLDTQDQKVLVNNVIESLQRENNIEFQSFKEAFFFMVNKLSEVKEIQDEKPVHRPISQDELEPNLTDFREKHDMLDYTDVEVILFALNKEVVVVPGEQIEVEKPLADNEILLSLHQDEINLIVTINENRNAALKALREKHPAEAEEYSDESVEETMMESLFMPERVLHSDQFYTGITSLDDYPIYNKK